MKITIEINGKTETFAGNWENRTLWKHFRSLASHRCMRPVEALEPAKNCLVNVNGENVLSCQTMCEDGMMVVLEAEQKAVIAETGDCYLYPADQTNRLVAACDIGTTTVVCHFAGWKNRRAAWYGQRTECTTQFWGRCDFAYSGGKRLRFTENAVCDHESDQSDDR